MSQVRHYRRLRYVVVGHIFIPLRGSEDGWRRKKGWIELSRRDLEIVCEIRDGRKRRLWKLLIDSVVRCQLRLNVRRLRRNILNWTVVRGTICIAVWHRRRHRLRTRKRDDLRSRFPIVFLFASTVPVQPYTVVACLALSLAVET